MANDILVADDEVDICNLISEILTDEGYKVRTARNCDQILTALKNRRPALIIQDIWMQGSRYDGLEMLQLIKAMDSDLPVIMISGHGTIETAVTAIKNGAYDFLEKPFKADHLLVLIRRALEATRLKRENRHLRAQALIPEDFTGESAAAQNLRQMITKIAPTNSRVLISGPPGSGKEVVARLIHKQSPRAMGEFIAVSAAGMTPERLDLELFGQEGGEHAPPKIGVFEKAHGGTLFLDEVADMPWESQGRILRVLVEQKFRRLGGDTDVQVDVRVLSASSRDLAKEISLGSFREDLFHRLNVVPLRVPGLSERREDIEVLAKDFMERFALVSGLPARHLGEDALAILQAHNWPGNVRQLRNNIERLLILATGDPKAPITANMLPSEVVTSGRSQALRSENTIALSLREAREVFEKEYLSAQIARFSGNISKTSAFIGMERSALHRKLKALGIPAKPDASFED